MSNSLIAKGIITRYKCVPFLISHCEKKKTFWTRYNRLLQTHERAKIDTEPIREAARILQWVLPAQLCLQITDYLQ